MLLPLPLILFGGGAVLLLSGKKSRSTRPTVPSGAGGGGSSSSSDGSDKTPDGYGSEDESIIGGSSDDSKAPLRADGEPWPSTTGVHDSSYPEPMWSPVHGELPQDSGLWWWKQTKLYVLGYNRGLEDGGIDGIPGGTTTKAIASFQSEWNFFVDYLNKINPSIVYKDPYTKISSDGYWGHNTDLRVNKALSKFNGTDPIYVEEIGKSVPTFHDMIVEIQKL